MARSAKSGSVAAKGGKRTPGKRTPAKSASSPIRREVWGGVLLFLGLFSLIGYFEVDAWFINWLYGSAKGLLGWGYYIFPPALLLSGVILVSHRGKPVVMRVVSALLLPLLLGTFVHMLFWKGGDDFSWAVLKELYAAGRDTVTGGFLSGLLGMGLKAAFSVYGAVPLVIVAFIALFMVSASVRPAGLIEWFKNREKLEYEPEEALPEFSDAGQPQLGSPGRTAARPPRRAIDIPVDDEEAGEYAEERVGFFNRKPHVKTPDEVVAVPEPEAETVEIGIESTDLPKKTMESAAPKASREEVAAATESIARAVSETEEKKLQYRFPPIDLLKSAPPAMIDGREEVALNRERLESTIRSFGVSASIVGVTRGPTVTRYDLELEQGVKLNKLTNLAGDLALSLGVISVRIAPIPNKISTVGIEVPNKLVSTVWLRDIIESPNFKNAPSTLSFAIGKDIGGNCVVGNISKLPHMLIAGTTGSGKSVCMNSLIISLLYKSIPDDVRLIMIDPKMVELGIYNGIPHLYIPVVTDPKKAAGALQWAVVEMIKRYRLFSEVGVRDIAGYNASQKKKGEETIPQVVIVIDELADLMLCAAKEVEESICRVAQMGRASGMHLIIATQRPSADVITGLMKANIPSRIAFAVSSAMESRIILDAQGAEKLVGMGDMLYAPLGAGKPVRIQGAFVSDEERESVIEFVKEIGEADYSDEIMSQIEKAAEDKSSAPKDASEAQDLPANDYDELLPQAVDVVLETKQASVSMLQRRLKLGYSRAARLMDQMEELKVVGPFEGSKARQIMVTRDQWREMQLINGTAPRETVMPEGFDDLEDF